MLLTVAQSVFGSRLRNFMGSRLRGLFPGFVRWLWGVSCVQIAVCRVAGVYALYSGISSVAPCCFLFGIEHWPLGCPVLHLPQRKAYLQFTLKRYTL